MERFFVYPNKKVEKNIEHFGFEDDNYADINLIVSGLDDCDAIIGSGDGKRDMFDFSDRFITAQIDASNNIPVFSRSIEECK